MSDDRSMIRSINQPFSNRVLVARGGDYQFSGSSRQSRQPKTFDLILAGDEAAVPDQPAAQFQPGGTQSSDKEQTHGSELAGKIYQGSLGIFRQFSEQHPDLHGSELLNAFLSELRVILAKGSAGSNFQGISDAEFESVSASVDSVIAQIRPMFKGQVSPETGSESKLNIFV